MQRKQVNSKMKNYIFTLTIGAIVILSFLLFSAVYSPVINADDGVSILMLHDFQLPRDIYYWDQNRYGSLIPLLGQFLYKLIRIPLLWSESITHYMILILGYFSFSSFFKSNFNKIIFAIIWFLPISYFGHSFLRNVYGLEYSVVGITIFLLKNYTHFETPYLKKISIIMIIFLSFIVSVWVSDLAFFTYIIILSGLVFFKLRTEKTFKSILILPETYYISIGFIMGIIIITYLKSIAVVDVNNMYNKEVFNSWEEIKSSILILTTILKDVFLFNTSNVFSSIYAYLSLFLVISIVFLNGEKINSGNEDKKWIWIFFFDAIILFVILVCSQWVFINGVARRYFTGVYIVLWIAYLLKFESVPKSKLKTVLKSILSVCVIVGAIHIVYEFKYVYPKRLTPKSDIVKEFEKLGNIGIIAEYWNSYGTSFVNPDLIKATPHDKSGVRNQELIDNVFNQPRIFIIKDMWLDSFPDTLNQFGRTLIKKDEMFYMGDCWVNEYTKE